MAVAARRRSGFGAILRRELDAGGVSTRELARRLTPGSPERLESVRRTLIRYINGEVAPGENARAEIAAALNLESIVFAESAVQDERRRRVVDALAPLAEALLAIATEVADLKKEEV